ncbi:hypothetical protein S245_040741 [Arachis hypogaea]
MVCKLDKAIYGFKQSPRAWFLKLQSTLHTLGFSTLFVRTTSASTIYLLAHVNDIVITGSNNSEIESIIAKLHSIFSLHVSPAKYVHGLLKKAWMDLSNSAFFQTYCSRK